MMNMDWDDLDFEIPPVAGRRWYRAIDTGAAAPDDISERARAAARVATPTRSRTEASWCSSRSHDDGTVTRTRIRRISQAVKRTCNEQR